MAFSVAANRMPSDASSGRRPCRHRRLLFPSESRPSSKRVGRGRLLPRPEHGGVYRIRACWAESAIAARRETASSARSPCAGVDGALARRSPPAISPYKYARPIRHSRRPCHRGHDVGAGQDAGVQPDLASSSLTWSTTWGNSSSGVGALVELPAAVVGQQHGVGAVFDDVAASRRFECP